MLDTYSVNQGQVEFRNDLVKKNWHKIVLCLVAVVEPNV